MYTGCQKPRELKNGSEIIVQFFTTVEGGTGVRKLGTESAGVTLGYGHGQKRRLVDLYCYIKESF